MSNTVTLQGNPVSVSGHFPVAGEQAKPFSLVAGDLSDATLATFAGKRKILNIFPSVDTPTCATSVRKFNEQASALNNTVVLCISADLPFAQSRFCGAEGLSNVITLSTLRSPDFLEKYGVANVILADGPAGIRITSHYQKNPSDGSVYKMNMYQRLENRIFGTEFLHTDGEDYYQYCSAIPVGTLLAQTFDTELLEEVGRMIGAELEEFGVTLWLAPGMNIHRNPLCGRNFEYYSEDPLVSGKMAAALTRGVQSRYGVGTTIKHYACNNQEENRRGVSSIVSERALREIYLKGFEIAIKESQPKAIMTSYNKVNGVHTANSYDLCTTAARKEWGFAGIIMTDWTTTNADGGSSAAKCIAAGNDLVMPGTDTDRREILDALSAENDQYLEEKDLTACAQRILEMIFTSNSYE